MRWFSGSTPVRFHLVTVSCISSLKDFLRTRKFFFFFAIRPINCSSSVDQTPRSADSSGTWARQAALWTVTGPLITALREWPSTFPDSAIMKSSPLSCVQRVNRDLTNATPIVGARHTFPEMSSLPSWGVPSDSHTSCAMVAAGDSFQRNIIWLCISAFPFSPCLTLDKILHISGRII